MNLLETAKQYKDGVETLKDWLGAGGVPVAQEEAEKRSSVCKSGDLDKDGKATKCRFNVAPNWLEENFTHPAALFIRAQLELKNQLDLHLENESQLGMCDRCGCDLKLKPWVPIKHILAHPPIHPLPSWCWIKKESQ